MLIGSDFCITNDIVLDFQRGKLVLHRDDKSTEVEIVCRRQEAREREDCQGSISNRQVIAIPTQVTDPCQLAQVKTTPSTDRSVL